MAHLLIANVHSLKSKVLDIFLTRKRDLSKGHLLPLLLVAGNGPQSDVSVISGCDGRFCCLNLDLDVPFECLRELRFEL